MNYKWVDRVLCMEELLAYRKDILEGKNIRLRSVSESDQEIFAKWWNDGTILLGNRSRLFATYESDNQKNFHNWSNVDHKYGFGLSIENKNGDVVGHLTSFGMTLPARIAELAICIGEEYQGHGYGQEAMQKGLQIVFEELNAHKAEVRVFSYNEKAIHVYEKVGFILEGKKRAALYHHGQYYDVLLMGILKKEFYDNFR